MARWFDPIRRQGRTEAMTSEELLRLFHRPANLVGRLSEADADEYLAIVTYLLIRDSARGRWVL